MLIEVILPLSLAIIMFSLGVGLTLGDFTRVFQSGWAFIIGALCQLVLVPVFAYLVITAFGMPGELAVGFMLLSFCPGGVTSNMISKFAQGDVALSVSLTAVMSILSILTVPFLATWAVTHFMGAAAPDVSVTSLAIAMFLITTLPVGLGVTLRTLAPVTADRIEPILSMIATVLFIVIVIGALASEWSTFIENVPTLGPALVTMNLALLIAGLLIAALVRLTWQERKTISIETGIQNATLGIAMAAIISGVSGEFSAMALPSAAYGITMYFVTLPFAFWYRSK